ncbi:hypothetical protein HZB03_03185 [Candidatus Woesearchaeota archaeon]|nr:hypothetical protein [Candidatus Woesearchaeota archaeon]
MEQSQLYRPQTYKPQTYKRQNNAELMPGEKAHQTRNSGRTSEKYESALHRDALKSAMSDIELLELMEQLGLVELGIGSRPYQGTQTHRSPALRSYFAPQNSYGILPQQGTKGAPEGALKHARLENLLTGTPKGQELYKSDRGSYTGLNIQYLNGDGTMYQFSAVGPAQNKRQMVSQVLSGLYAAMMSDGYDRKKDGSAEHHSDGNS